MKNTPSVTVEDLLAHNGFLRRLARSLVRDETRADDVVQQTYIQALRAPPRDGARIRSWLTVVTRNVARKLCAAEQREMRREQRAARPEALPATSDVVSRAQLRHRVASELLEMNEPYRTTLLLRFYEELPPRVISRQLGVSPETVRTRTRRGLEVLRRRLDRQFGDRSHWSAALVPFESGGFTIVGAGFAAPRWVALWIASWNFKLAALLMSLSAVALIMMMQISGTPLNKDGTHHGGMMGSPGVSIPSKSPAGSSRSATADADVANATAGASASAGDAADTAPSRPASGHLLDPPYLFLRGWVRDENLEPCPEADVKFGELHMGFNSVSTNADGRFEIELDLEMVKRDWFLAAIKGDSVAVVEDFGRELLGAGPLPVPTLTLKRWNLTLSGSVQDPAGEPQKGLRVWLGFPRSGFVAHRRGWGVNTDADGKFVFEHVPPGITPLFVIDLQTLDYLRSDPVRVGSNPVVLTLERAPLLQDVTVRVLLPEGSPVPGATLRLDREGAMSSRSLGSTGRDGSCTLENLPQAGFIDVLCGSTGPHVIDTRLWLEDASSGQVLTARFTRPCRVRIEPTDERIRPDHIRVLDGNGRPQLYDHHLMGMSLAMSMSSGEEAVIESPASRPVILDVAETARLLVLTDEAGRVLHRFPLRPSPNSVCVVTP